MVYFMLHLTIILLRRILHPCAADPMSTARSGIQRSFPLSTGWDWAVMGEMCWRRAVPFGLKAMCNDVKVGAKRNPLLASNRDLNLSLLVEVFAYAQHAILNVLFSSPILAACYNILTHLQSRSLLLLLSSCSVPRAFLPYNHLSKSFSRSLTGSLLACCCVLDEFSSLLSRASTNSLSRLATRSLPTVFLEQDNRSGAIATLCNTNTCDADSTYLLRARCHDATNAVKSTSTAMKWIGAVPMLHLVEHVTLSLT